MNKPMDFQSIMLRLHQYWGEQGCLIWQPYYSQVGAGTNNPATFLRVLGPEPWKVGYVEPSVRPDDGRYGENPNRLQQHYQYQVILKPDPGNPQELYLKSLEAIGIDPLQHDIRFVEDNWESPALGAWGLGWEVWLDGQEITQFTYFQQAGGIVLEPVSVEITYGLERIAMALQGVRNFREIQWSPDVRYGEVNLQAEQEHSKYYFEVADVDRLRQMYALYEAEANTALEKKLVLPAYDYILKCSHTFNVLDTRGAVGVTERQAMFGKMRDLSRRVAEAYLEQRQSLGFPFLKEGRTSEGAASAAAEQPENMETVAASDAPQSFVFEIGTEELPAADLESAMDQLRARVPALLDDLHLAHGAISVMGTPRRLVVQVAGLAASQPDRETVVKGPPAERGFDAAGQPNKAAEGFARSKGLAVGDLQVREMDGGRYLSALIAEKGRSTVEVLAQALPGLVAAIKFDKSMRWNSSGVAFSRPIRWFLALLGSRVVPFEYAGYSSGRTTRGLRFNHPETLTVVNADEYAVVLQAQGVILDPTARCQTIAAQVARLAKEVGGDVPDEPALLDEVTQLVEAPTALRGSFDPAHLKLPAEVLVSVMKKHQRYFPVMAAGRLLPYFIAVRNGGERYLDVVADGNEQVIRARFADAAFFIEEDLRQPLADFLPRLGTLTFQKKLGSMLDKTQRIEKLVDALLTTAGLSGEEAGVARRAAALSKADLVTKMVIEMTALQGVMGRYYARHSGEPEAVAEAIFEHYLPRFTGDALPKGRPGLVVGIADRLDSLAGLFAAGLAPTGTKDPFAQRRAAIGLVQNLIAWDMDFDLRAGLEQAALGLPIPAAHDTLSACLEFIVGRLRSLLIEQGHRYDVVDAVLAAQRSNPAGSGRSVRQLGEWVSRPDWTTILPAYARCVRITRDIKERFTVDAARLDDPAEKELLDALEKAERQPRSSGSVNAFFDVFLPLIPAINRFFEAVLVMSEDPAQRANRLGMLQRITALANGTADLSQLEGF